MIRGLRYSAAMFVSSATLVGQEFPRSHPTLSPDGSQIAYHVNLPGNRTALYVASSDGTNERVLFRPDASNAQEPRWSPDGNWIAFVGGPDYEDNHFSLFVIRPDGTELRRLFTPDTGLAKSPSWQSNGRFVSVAERSYEHGWTRVHLVDVETGESELLGIPGDGHNYHPRWGHSTGRLLLTWWNSERTDGNLFIWDPNSPSQRTWITDSEGMEGMPAWSPDERYVVFYIYVEEAQFDLWLLDLVDESMENITNTDSTNEFFPEFSRDGDRLYYQTLLVEESGNRRSEIIWRSFVDGELGELNVVEFQ